MATLAPVRLHFPRAFSSGITRTMDRPASPARSDERAELTEMLAAVGQRDAAALRAVYRRTSAKLYGIGLRLLGNEAEAHDLLQDVYLQVWAQAARFDALKGSPITWLAVLTRNKAIDRLRARRLPEATLDAAGDVADGAPSALDGIAEAEETCRLEACLDELDPGPRQMIRAAFLDGLTYAQLAEREAVPLGTMKSWVRRGLLRLRGCLER